MSDQEARETADSEEIRVRGQDVFRLEGDVHRLVTFLNQCLKDKNLVFGLSKHDEESLCLKIYETTD